MLSKIFKAKGFVALAYVTAITIFTAYSTYLGFSTIPYEIISFLPFIALVCTFMPACMASVKLYEYAMTKSKKSLKLSLIFVALSAIFPVSLYQGATPGNNPKMERLFNIPIGAQVTNENIKLWSEKYPSKEFIIANKEDGVTSIRITPKSLVNVDELSSIEYAKIVYLNILSNKEGTIREIQWLDNPNYRGIPDWSELAGDFVSNIWIGGGIKRRWDGRFMVEEGKGEVFLRIYATDALSLPPASEKLSERLGRAKLHSMFGE